MIGDNIKFYRKKNQLTQDDIAEACNVTRQAVSKWENGKTQPDIQTLSMLASTLEVSEEDLIYGAVRFGEKDVDQDKGEHNS